MSDVNETLQDLMERRLNDLGRRRGRGESISLREAYQRFLDQHNEEAARRVNEGVVDDRPPPPTYEVFRRIRSKGHTRITDVTASALADMLEVPVEIVYAAAKIKPRLGRFELPTRADRLDAKQREVVLSVVDAILGTEAVVERAEDKFERRRQTEPTVAQVRAARQARLDQEAARDVGREGSVTKLRTKQDQAGEPPVDNPDDMEPR